MLYISCIISILSILIYYIYYSSLSSSSTSITFNSLHSNGIIFISDGSIGFTRNLAFDLIEKGYYVIIGVKTQHEKDSFIYELRKGLDIALFDINIPQDLAKIIFYIREIELKLQRYLNCLIINNIDEIKYYHELDLTNKKKEKYNEFDMNDMDNSYKRFFKGFYRLFQVSCLLDKCITYSIYIRIDYMIAIV